MRAKRCTLRAAGLLAAAVSLAACGVAAPTATPVLPPFQSGGIGLTRAAWEQQHPPLTPPTVGGAFVGYPDSGYTVTFWGDWPPSAPTADSVITRIFFTTHIQTPELRSAVVRSFLPVDAQLEPKAAYPEGEMWYSPSLVNRYPRRASVPQPWGKFGPGRISVHYQNKDSYTSLTIGVDLKYPPAPTAVLTVIPTPTLCGAHPCPTPILPSPVPTAVRSPLPRGVGTKLPVPIATGGLVPVPTATLPHSP